MSIFFSPRLKLGSDEADLSAGGSEFLHARREDIFRPFHRQNKASYLSRLVRVVAVFLQTLFYESGFNSMFTQGLRQEMQSFCRKLNFLGDFHCFIQFLNEQCAMVM
jgi:hypothetical protein